MEVIIEWHREDYICLSLTHLNVRIDKGYIHVNVCRITSRTFPHWWLVARITRRVPLVGQTLLTLPEHLSSPTVFSGVRVTRSLVVCVCFADRCLSFCTFSFDHCVVCSSLIFGFWLVSPNSSCRRSWI